MSAFRGVILDVDGTLVDSNDAHANAWVTALAEHEIAVPYAKVRRLIGMGGDKLLPTACGLSEDSPEGKKINKRRGEIFKDRYLPALRPTPGARELLVRMHSEGLKLVVASSAKADELEPLLKICGADEFIQSKTSSDDAENSKPDPDIIQAALDELGLSEADVVMIGDTPYDIQAAQKLKIPTIAFRCGGWDDVGLANALAVFADPADLLSQYSRSPLN